MAVLADDPLSVCLLHLFSRNMPRNFRCYVMLCYVMLCYVMLCYVMLCYVMLRYVSLCFVMLQHTHIITNNVAYNILHFTSAYVEWSKS
jgi:hypothetical protein